MDKGSATGTAARAGGPARFGRARSCSEIAAGREKPSPRDASFAAPLLMFLSDAAAMSNSRDSLHERDTSFVLPILSGDSEAVEHRAPLQQSRTGTGGAIPLLAACAHLSNRGRLKMPRWEALAMAEAAESASSI